MNVSRTCFFLTLATLCGVGIPAQAFPPDTLAQALPRTTDRANRRIPLLVIGAETARYDGGSETWQKLHELYAEENAKPPISSVVSCFNRQIVSCASVQVIAPPVRFGINPYPGKPEEWARIGRERASCLLFQSLSPAQWKTASSPRGLGLPDLQTPEQKAWFLSALPDALPVHEVEKNEGEHSGSRTVGNTVVLKPETLRLRVVRSMSWNYRQGSSGFIGFGQSDADARKPGERFWEQVYTEEAVQDVQTYRDRISKAVILSEPNRYISGGLPMNKPPLFGKTVSLEGAKTVGDLVMRIAQTTGIELYADRRISARSVMYLGSPDARADCADLTKALCLATTGTVRAVSEEKGGQDEAVYILTGTQAGSAAPRLALSEWASDVEALLNAEKTALQTVAKKGDFVANIGFDPESPGAIGSDVMQAAEQKIRFPDPTSSNYGYQPIPVSALSPAAQEQVRRDLEQHAQWQSNNASQLDSKTVYALFSVKTQIVAEGYGVFSGSQLASLGDLVERKPVLRPAPKSVATANAVTLPSVLTQFAALRIAPTGISEAHDAANWAQSRGFSALFVPVSLWDDADISRLAKVVVGTMKSGVAVYPVVSLFRVPPQDAEACADLARTRNVSGETLREYGKRREGSPGIRLDEYAQSQIAPLLTGDWLDAFDSAVQSAVAKRLATVAATPGIGGLVLADIAAPGMQDASPEWTNGATGGRYGGYTLANRIAFIRQENVDPLDLLPSGNLQPYLQWDGTGNSYEPPPFHITNYQVEEILRSAAVYRRGTDGQWGAVSPKPDSRERSPWNALLWERNRVAVAKVREAAHLPESLRVWAMVLPEGYSSPCPVPWQNAEPLPPAKTGIVSLYTMSLRQTSTAETVRTGAARIAEWAQKQKTFPYGGMEIDVTAKPFAESLALLSAFAPVSGEKP